CAGATSPTGCSRRRSTACAPSRARPHTSLLRGAGARGRDFGRHSTEIPTSPIGSRPMTAGDWAAVAAAGAAVLAVVGLLVAMASLTRTLAALRVAVDDLRRQTMPLLGDVQ